jgi:hypothetical protein
VIIDHTTRRRIPGFDEADVLAALHEAFGQRPDWWSFDADQPSKLLFVCGYFIYPPEDADVEAALPLACEDLDRAA